MHFFSVAGTSTTLPKGVGLTIEPQLKCSLFEAYIQIISYVKCNTSSYNPVDAEDQPLQLVC